MQNGVKQREHMKEMCSLRGATSSSGSFQLTPNGCNGLRLVISWSGRFTTEKMKDGRLGSAHLLFFRQGGVHFFPGVGQEVRIFEVGLRPQPAGFHFFS